MLAGIKNMLRPLVWTVKNRYNNSIKPYGGRWDLFKEIDKNIPSAGINSPRKKLLLFGCNSQWIDYLAIIGFCLRKLGYDITLIWTDEEPLEYGRAPYSAWSSKFPVPKFENFKLINFDRFKLGDEKQDFEEAQLLKISKSVAEIDVLYNLKNEKFEGEPSEKKLFDLRVNKNFTFLLKLVQFLKQNSFESFLTGNGAFLEMGSFCHYLRETGKRCVSLDTFELGNGLVADWRMPSIYWNTAPVWEAFREKTSSEHADQFVQDHIAQREQKKTGHQIAEIEESETNLIKLGFNPDKPAVLLAANLVWDSAVLKMNRTFSGIEEMVVKTIRWFEKYPNIQLLVRMHPVESRVEQPKSLEDRVRAQISRLPDNVFIISSDAKVNSYAILPKIKFGIVYTSTIGLEMAIRGIKVVTTGITHYAGKGFTLDPIDEQEYFSALEDGLRDSKFDFDLELAKKYYFIYFKHFPKELPWRLYNCKEELRNFPPDQLFTSKNCEIYLDTLKFLAGEDVEHRGW